MFWIQKPLASTTTLTTAMDTMIIFFLMWDILINMVIISLILVGHHGDSYDHIKGHIIGIMFTY